MPSLSAEYVAAEAPTSLADGKITFRYNDSGAITNLTMMPDGGETLTLSGDTLSFASGARLDLGMDGVSCISNAISQSGTLNIGPTQTNITWKGSNLSSTEVQIFAGVRLDDISPVSAWGSFTCYPYWVVRDGDTMTIEFQVRHGGTVHTKGVRVQLRQNGENIVAKKLTSGYWSAKPEYLGFYMNKSGVADETYTSYTYQISQMSFEPRHDTFDYRGNLISSAFETTVATNVSVADVEVVYGASGHETRHDLTANIARARMEPSMQSYDEGTGILSVQMLNTNTAGRVKCVKLELKQSGADVVVRAAYAKYIDGTDYGFDFDEGGTEVAVATEANLADAASVEMYGIDMLSLKCTKRRRRRLVLPVSGTVTKNKPLAGAGVEVAFVAASETATVDVTGDNTGLTESAFILKGEDDNALVFKSHNAKALPDGETIAYGNVQLRVVTGSTFTSGVSGGLSAIKMYDGSGLYQSATWAFHPTDQMLAFSAAHFYVQSDNAGDAYANIVTLADGSQVHGGDGKLLRLCYTVDADWKVIGSGASSCDADLELLSGNNSTAREVVFTVQDTTGDDNADFIMDGNFIHYAGREYGSIAKKGPGTMLLNGQYAITNNPARIVEGSLVLGTSGSAHTNSNWSLEGGTLALAAGTANTAKSLAVTADSTLSVGTGASLTLANVSVADGSTLAVEYDGGFDGKGLKISAALDDETLSRITLNGRRVAQTSDGRLCLKGLILIFK